MTTAPYGKWTSPITEDAITQNTISIADVIVDPVQKVVYHLENRPSEQGRTVIVNTSTDKDVFGAGFNARSSVNEYGGAAAIVYEGIVYFTNATDSRVYRIDQGIKAGAPEPITPENKYHKYANFVVHPEHKHLVVAIFENHRDHELDNPRDIDNFLYVINTITKETYPLVTGADFYVSPVFTPDGKKIAWQEWYHPDMPWEGSLLYVADVILEGDRLAVSNATYVAGEKFNISVSYPLWANNTTLVFTSDEGTGYQHPWKYSTVSGKVEFALLKDVKEDFGDPGWLLGMYPFAFLDHEGNIALFTAYREGRSILYLVDIENKKAPVEVDSGPFVSIHNIRQVSGGVVFTGLKCQEAGGVILCLLPPSFDDPKPTYMTLKSTASATSISPHYISTPIPRTFPRGDKPIHVIYYLPKNKDFVGPTDEKPPCIVNVHGGPTSMAGQELKLTTQYFTSRGYTWLDVNYGGSSGYGREYIGRLVGQWGVVDVQDCIDAARYLGDLGLVDSKRIAIRGGSSGGYATLAAMSVAPDVTFFAAGTSNYGISNLIQLSKFTDKMELHYMERLLGGTAAEIPEVYKARSPYFNAEKIKKPLLILQGSDDKVVPPDQSKDIVDKIVETGGADRVEYHEFAGEGHGWRKAETIKQALIYERTWYEQRVLPAN